MKQKIIVRYLAVDGYSATRRFATLAGARKYAQDRVGEHPDQGGWHAVSYDGVGRVTVEGATLADLFPAPARPKCPSIIPSGMYWDDERGCLEYAPNEAGYIAMQGDPLAIYEGLVDPDPVYEDTPCPSRGPTHDTPESLSEDGGFRWPDDCPF